MTTTYGELDGETISLASLKISGAAAAERRYEPGERIVLIIEGVVADQVTIKRDQGRLTRTHTIRMEHAATPVDQLAEEAADFLQAMADELEGRQALPFEDEDDPADDNPPDEEPPGADADES